MNLARDIVRARGGDWCGSYGLVSGPGHSAKDRSLKVWQADGRVLVHSFAGDDWRECRRHLGLDADRFRSEQRHVSPAPEPAQPTARVRKLLRTVATPEMVPAVVDYCGSRGLWPFPPGCSLRAHVAVEYWEVGDRPVLLGRYPALVSKVQDSTGELVTAHVTYVPNGRKLTEHAPRKILSSTQGRTGCAVRLMPLQGPVLAVGEGIETCLAAHRLTGLPVWACLNTSLLAKFVPPPEVSAVMILADNDEPGLRAAEKLRDRLQVQASILRPRGGDFAEDWEAANA